MGPGGRVILFPYLGFRVKGLGFRVQTTSKIFFDMDPNIDPKKLESAI